MQNPKDNKTPSNQARLALLDKICRNVKSAKQHLPVISCIAQMTRYSLNASASALVLIDEQDKTLVNRYTDGPLGNQFRQFPLDNLLGVTRWVIRNARPLAVKDIGRDDRSGNVREEVAGVVPRSIICAPLVIGGKVVGALEALNKLDGDNFSENDAGILAGLAGNAVLTIENIRLNESLLYSCKDNVQKLVSLLDVRESTASKHSGRVAKYAVAVAGAFSLSREEKQAIEYAAILHDIGMLGIPESVLNKTGKLSAEEWNFIRRHPVVGYHLLRGIPSLNQVAKLILYHHERFDGKGYPCGLRGETIPIGARIIAVVDAFDSMTVKHSYRAAMNPRDAVTEIGKCAGTQFCPRVARTFCVNYLKARAPGNVRVTGQAPVSVIR